MPYQAWCPICVAAEGKHSHNRKAREDDAERMGVTISMDYCFLTSQDDIESDPKILVMHDDKLETLWALCVQAKGEHAEVVTWVVQKLDEAGYRGKDITINTIQETSVMAFKRAIAARREGVTTPIESKVRVSENMDAWREPSRSGEGNSEN